MESWAVEVKSDKLFDVNLAKGEVLHVTQACLGEDENSKDRVCLQVIVGGQKIVLGTLRQVKPRLLLLDLAFEKDFQISHNWEMGSVNLFGYKFKYRDDEQEDGITIIGNREPKNEKKTFSCNICKSPFKKKADLTCHIRDKHKRKHNRK